MSQYSKAWVAAVMAILGVLDQIFGWSLPGISEQWVSSIIFVLTPILVWFVPNRPA